MTGFPSTRLRPPLHSTQRSDEGCDGGDRVDDAPRAQVDLGRQVAEVLGAIRQTEGRVLIPAEADMGKLINALQALVGGEESDGSDPDTLS